MKKYALAPIVTPDIATSLNAYSSLVQQILFSRGVHTQREAEEFLSPQFLRDRHDPFLMTDMEKAVTRVLAAIKAGEHIAIYSDYDCDGIPGGVVLHDFFKLIGFSNFENYIPHRHDEGYGLSVEALDALIDRGASLIITIDCGTTDHAPIAHARSRGVDVIVTDHHEAGHELPEAYAILNPKRDDAYPFRELCGSGVVWKLIEGLLARGDFGMTEGKERWLLDMVGLATLADRVSLRGENRMLAHYGLVVLRKTRRVGLQALFRALRTDARYITEDDVGFMIGPRINAASRMGAPEDAFKLLTATTDAEGKLHAEHLERINNERKGVVASLVKDMKKRLVDRVDQPVVVIGDPLWRPSLLGLAANTLVETYKRPAFVWGRDGRDVFKGSCRSDGSISVVSLMQEVKEVFIEYGGHHFSGGFSVAAEHIHTFGDRLQDAYVRVGSEVIDEVQVIDADLSLAEITPALVRQLAELSPFGEGNAKPVFRFCGITPIRIEQFGKTKEHFKMVFENSNRTLEAISFFTHPESFSTLPQTGKRIDLVAHIEESRFGGRTQTRLRIIDVLPA